MPTASSSPAARLRAALFQPIDLAWLVFFRLGAGVLIATEHAGAVVLGHPQAYLASRQHFTYLLAPLPNLSAPVLYALYAAVIGAGLAVASGWYYRAATIILCVGCWWIFLLDSTSYINHHYLFCLVAGLLVVLPAHRAASLDVRAGRVTPAITAPAWTRYLLLGQLGLVYFFAGLAKLNADWLAARPLTVWLSHKGSWWLVGPLLTQPWLPWLMSYAGLLLDLLVAPLLLWRPTRPWAYGAAAFFHLSNVIIFGLGTFPWFSLLMTALFFDPDFPRRLPDAAGRWFRRQVPMPVVGTIDNIIPSRSWQQAVVAGLTIYGAVQVAVPLRHFLYPGQTHWTEEGHNFAWHMMLRSKMSTASFRVRFATDGHEEIADLSTIVAPTQHRFADHPDCLLRVAHWLAADYQMKGHPLSAVFVDSRVALNGRPAQPLIAPDVNLLHHRPTLHMATWLAPAPE
ncbi:HTTM domain-containing protein [Hymenobacter terrenus]|uniref:HTTM domain-containing protein n=1 Tax=Hymenobacter terrenus TaxID=1629124 RepID=UPI0006980E35|nr:HTTM domain-containing protein [Hymenobacter terrenus]